MALHEEAAPPVVPKPGLGSGDERLAAPSGTPLPDPDTTTKPTVGIAAPSAGSAASEVGVAAATTSETSAAAGLDSDMIGDAIEAAKRLALAKRIAVDISQGVPSCSTRTG